MMRPRAHVCWKESKQSSSFPETEVFSSLMNENNNIEILEEKALSGASKGVIADWTNTSVTGVHLDSRVRGSCEAESNIKRLQKKCVPN